MNKTLNDEDEMFELEGMKLFEPKSKIITQTMVQRQHYYSIDSNFDNQKDFDDLIKLLLTTPSGEIIRLYICSFGGRISIADNIISKIYEARSRGVVVLADLGTDVASAATAVALACDDITCSPATCFLIHNWSSGLGYGTAEDLYQKAVFNKKQSEAWFRMTYEKFLTEEELEDLIKHPRDFELSAEEVMTRWNAMVGEDDGEPQFNLDELIEKKVQEALTLKEKPKPVPKPKTTKKKPTV